MTETEQKPAKDLLPVPPIANRRRRSWRVPKFVWWLVAAVAMAGGGVALVLWLSQTRAVVLAWELRAPEEEMWSATVTGNKPDQGFIVGSGPGKSAVWVDPAGSVLCASPATKYRIWRSFIGGGAEPQYGFYAADLARNALQIIPAPKTKQVGVDLTELTVSPEATALPRPRVLAGEDGKFYACLSTVDIWQIDAAGQVLRQIVLDAPIRSFRGAGPEGELFGYSGKDELSCFTPDGKLGWRCAFPRGSFVVSPHAGDGGACLKVGNRLVRIGPDGKTLWEQDVKASLGVQDPSAAVKYFNLDNRLWLGYCSDYLFAIDDSGQLAWSLDFFETKGFLVVDADLDQGQPEGGLIVLLYRPEAKHMRDLLRSEGGAPNKVDHATHIARVSAKGEVTGIWRLPAGRMRLAGTGVKGEVYLACDPNPSGKLLDFVLRRYELP